MRCTLTIQEFSDISKTFVWYIPPRLCFWFNPICELQLGRPTHLCLGEGVTHYKGFAQNISFESFNPLKHQRQIMFTFLSYRFSDYIFKQFSRSYDACIMLCFIIDVIWLIYDDGPRYPLNVYLHINLCEISMVNGLIWIAMHRLSDGLGNQEKALFI